MVVFEHLWQSAAELASRRMSYAGEVVTVCEDIMCDRVVAVWPKVGKAALCPIVDYIDPHLAAEISDPCGCLRPAYSAKMLKICSSEVCCALYS